MSHNNDDLFKLLAKLGKTRSPQEAGKLLEEESASVDESFLFYFTDSVSRQLTAMMIYPESKFLSISQLAFERYNVTLILELLHLQNLEWVFFFKDNQQYFRFPFTLTYFDILLEGETGRKQEYILSARESILRFATARDLLCKVDPGLIEAGIRESFVHLNTVDAKNYLADCVNDNGELHDKALFCLQLIADHAFNAPLDTISSPTLKESLIHAATLPESKDQAKALQKILDQLSGKNVALIALIQFHIAHAFANSRTGEISANLEAALYHYQQAGKFYTKERDPYAWAKIQNGFACCYGIYQKGGAGANIERAITFLDSAQMEFSRIDTPYDWAYTQNNLGSAYLERIYGDRADNVKTAISCFEAALSAQSILYCPEAWALSMSNLGEAFNNIFAENRIENGPKAISIFQRVAELYSELSHPYEWAVLQRRIGSVYVTLSSADPFKNAEMALAYFLKAKTFLTPDRDTKEWLLLMRQMGDAYSVRIQGDTMTNQESAIACYKSSFAFQTIDSQPYSWATLHHALALCYRIRLRGTRAENLAFGKRHLDEAKLVLTREKFPEDWASLEHLLGILAIEHRKPNQADDYENAIVHFNNALKIRNPVSSLHLWTESMNSLAGAYIDRKSGYPVANRQKGIEIYNEVLEKLSPKTNRQNWCIITADLGRALVIANSAGDPLQRKQAQVLFQEVLNFQTPVSNPRECFKVSFMLGKLHFENDNFNEALKTFQLSFESSENLRAQSVHDFFRRQLAAETSELFQRMVTCCLKLKDTSQALYYATAGKARVFADRLQNKEPANPHADGIVLPLQVRVLQQKIEELRLSIDQITTSREYVLTGGLFLNNDNKSLLDLVAEKRRGLLKLLEEVAFQFPAFSDVRQMPAVSAEQLKQLSETRPAECWAEYYRDYYGWGVFILKSGRLDYVNLPDVTRTVLEDIFNYMAECERLALAGKMLITPDDLLQKHLSILYNAFVEPISVKLSTSSRIVLSLTGELSLLPINIAFDTNNGKYLCEQYPLSFIPSLNALFWLLVAESKREIKPTKKQRLMSVVHPGHSKATRLLFAQKESEILAHYFLGEPSSVILKENQALVADILKYCNSGEFDTIHFACHGNFNPGDPIHSGLQLEDGVLTAERIQASGEIKNKPLILLSACQTGQVTIAAGDESIGLTQSFFAAGAGTVISSQWSVNDASSMEIFRQFFAFNQSVSKAEALQHAILVVKKMHGWSHPLYWAAFKITGLAD